MKYRPQRHRPARPGGGIPGRVRADLSIRTIDGSCLCLTMGAGESGLVATLPMLTTAIVPRFSPVGIREG